MAQEKTGLKKPEVKPAGVWFGSGPVEPAGYSDARYAAELKVWRGVSPRSSEGAERLKGITDKIAQLAGTEERWLAIGGSDTAAVEAGLINLLGETAVTVIVMGAFSADWAKDVTAIIGNRRTVTILKAQYGKIPDLDQVNWDNDVILVGNETSAGTRLDLSKIPNNRKGLVIADLTSMIFTEKIDWSKIDYATFSGQKALGAEAGIGYAYVGPRAEEKLNTFNPSAWISKLFTLKSGGKFNWDLTKGKPINTLSWAAAISIDLALDWFLEKVKTDKNFWHKKTLYNYREVEEFLVNQTNFAFFVDEPAARSHTSVTLKVKDEWFIALENDQQKWFFKAIHKLLADESAAKYVSSYKKVEVPGVRVWCGPTVEAKDIRVMLCWLEWAYLKTKRDFEFVT